MLCNCTLAVGFTAGIFALISRTLRPLTGIAGRLLPSLSRHDSKYETTNFYVRIPGGVSKSNSVLSGVPQGTVLGPVLFLVLISDISSNVSSNITSFPNDTKVFATINDSTDCDNLQSDLDNIYLWSSEIAWCLTKKNSNTSVTTWATQAKLTPQYLTKTWRSKRLRDSDV